MYEAHLTVAVSLLWHPYVMLRADESMWGHVRSVPTDVNSGTGRCVMSITQEDAFGLTAWVQSLSAWAYSLGNTCRPCEEHQLLSLHDFLSTGHHLLVVSFITSLKSNVCTALTTWNTAVNNCFILHAQDTTALETCILNWNTPITVHMRRTVVCDRNHRVVY